MKTKKKTTKKSISRSPEQMLCKSGNTKWFGAFFFFFFFPLLMATNELVQKLNTAVVDKLIWRKKNISFLFFEKCVN